MNIIQRFEPGRLDEQMAAFLKEYNRSMANQSDIIPEALIESVREIGEYLFVSKLATATPCEVARVEELKIASKQQRTITLRIYHPIGEGPFPILLFIHGGGWCVGSLNTHDALARALAHDSASIVVSVEYHLAPEHKYPAALEDVQVAYEWVLANKQTLNSNGKVALAGDSAGGNLASCLALKCRDEGMEAALFQLLIYPATDLSHTENPSHQEYGEGYYLTLGQVEAYQKMYIKDAREAFDAYVSPLQAANLEGLPPAIICTAEFDLIRDEAEAYAKKLAAAGNTVHCIRYNGVTHVFLQMDRVLDKARIAQKELAELVKEWFEKLA